ncbi:MAG: prolyl oligopeptidase family serine peptidase [Gemmatimonadales bacterium]|nr:prolyl oligopeptidase family serine peptidase [Gemmatimonadales bacterium]
MIRPILSFGLCLTLVSLSTAAEAQTKRFELTVPSIMRGPETVGREPAQVRWSPDAQWIYFRWLPPGTDWRENTKPYRIRPAAGAAPEALSNAAADSLEPQLTNGPLSPDRKRKVVSVRGDLYLVDLPVGTVRALTNTPSVVESNPLWDLTGRRVFFRRENNIFALDVAQGGVEQITDIRPGPAPEDPRALSGSRGFVEKDEIRLLQSMRDQKWRDSVDKAERDARQAALLKPFYLGRNEQVQGLSPSPSGTAVLITLFTPAAEAPRATIVPNYVTLTGYTEDLPARTKVGDAQGRFRIGMLTAKTGAVKWIRPITGDTSSVYGNLNTAGWNDAGTSALVAATTRDYTTRQLSRVDADSAKVTSLEVIRDSAWVGGPCGFCVGWLPGNQGLWFVNEATGYSHLYTIDPNGGNRRQRTAGKWEVLAAELSVDRTRWTLHTSEVSPFERHAYLLPVADGPMVRLTSEVGGHTVELSPDGKLMADVYSTANRPGELFVQAARMGAPKNQLTLSPTAEWLTGPWIKPEIVNIPASDGVNVPARIYRPSDVGAQPNGAAVIFVHGAGYLHNVHNYWSTYFREYQFNHLLASKGYVVLDIDYRASAGYGRDWRTAIYRWMGGRDLQDHVDGSKWLQKTYNIDPERIGIYGGSYGGFITLMALFTAPKDFGAGAALRSVTDWAHYNHGYTAQILNEPQEDSVAYRKSSPIYFAEGLEDPLLMLHGMVDVNVHFQDIVRLQQRLIELGKTNWELAAYPLEDHGFVRPDSWTDEYRRILELFEAKLRPR